MKPAHLPIVLMVFATLLADLMAVQKLSSYSASYPAWPALFLIGIAFGQVGVLAFWTALGGWLLLLRMGLTMVVISLLATALVRAAGLEYAEWLGVLSIYTLATAVPCFGLRMAGLRLGQINDGPSSPSVASPGLGPRQFSLGSLILATTAAAALLGMTQWMDFPWTDAAIVVVFCFGWACTALAALWMVYGKPRLAFRLPALAVIVAIAVLLGYLDKLAGGAEPLAAVELKITEAVVITICQSGFVLLFASGLYVCGFRLEPHGSRAS